MCKQLLIVLLLCYICYKCYGFNIRYTTTTWKEGDLKISTSELTPNSIGASDIKVIRVTQDDKHDLELVSDFHELERFEMEIKRDFPPEFKNLSNIRQLDLDKNNFLYVKKETFSNIPVQRVNINNNQISRIEKGAFGVKLKSLRVMCNNLKTFNSNWFRNLSSLEELNLGGNLLTIIEANLFKPLVNLNDIVLSYNDISSIGDGAFSNRKGFQFFYVPYNNLKELKPTIFGEGEIRIYNFAINNNNLTFLSTDLLNKLKILTSLDLDDNPWQCKCWEVIKEWVPSYLRVFRDPSRPVCVQSLSFSQFCVPFVDSELIEHFSANNDPPHYNKNYYCS